MHAQTNGRMSQVRSSARRCVTRRQALTGAAGLAVSVALAACGGQPSAPLAGSAVTSGALSSVRAGATTASATRLTAAAAATSSAAPAVQAPAAGGVTVNFLARGDDYIFKLFRSQAAEFNKTVPKVTLAFQDVPGSWYQKLQAEIAGGTPPDAVFECDCSLGASVRNKTMESVDPYLAKEKDFQEADFEPNSWFAMTYNGKRWGLPWDSGAYALFFNHDLFQAAGIAVPAPTKRMTWDELVQLARQLTVDANGRTAVQSGFDPTKIARYGFETNNAWGQANIIFSYGGELLNKDGSVPLDSSAAIDAIQLQADMGTRYQIKASPAYPQKGQTFGIQQKNVAIGYEGVWLLGRMNSAGISWSAAPTPKHTVDVAGGHYSPLAMLATSKVKDATWQWLYWATLSDPGQRMLVNAGQMQPMRKSLLPLFVGLNQAPDKASRQVFADELAAPFLRVPGDRYGSYWGGYHDLWLSVSNKVLGPVYKGTKRASEIAPELRREIEVLLKTGVAPA
jgi:multiple sugar transport system substrate-binding protein